MGDIVCVICQEDQVVAVPKVKRVDDFLIELLTDLTIFQFRVAQRHEKAMLITVSYLLRGEDNIDQVLPKFAGKSLLQQIQVLLCFVLRENPHRFINVWNDFTAAIDKTAIDTADSIPIHTKTATQFTYFFQIQFRLPRLSNWSSCLKQQPHHITVCRFCHIPRTRWIIPANHPHSQFLEQSLSQYRRKRSSVSAQNKDTDRPFSLACWLTVLYWLLITSKQRVLM